MHCLVFNLLLLSVMHEGSFSGNSAVPGVTLEKRPVTKLSVHRLLCVGLDGVWILPQKGRLCLEAG